MITPSFSLTATERVLPKLALDFTTAALDSRVTFTRTTGASNPATYVNSSGLVVLATNNQPRFDHDPLTLACKGLLIEESRTNIQRQSEDFNTTWSKSNSTVTTNTHVAPDGNTTADTLTTTAANGNVNYLQGVTNGTTYTFSFWAKKIDSDTVRISFANVQDGPIFTFSTKTLSTSANWTGSFQEYPNGWFRIIATRASNTTFAGMQISVPTSGQSVALWGAQLEAGAFATSYIPTTTAALTRNADVATMTGTNFSDWFNASEGTFVMEGSGKGFGIFSANSSTTNFIDARIRTNDTTSIITDTGSVQAAMVNSAASNNGAFFKSALGYKANNFGYAANGSAPVLDNSGSVPSSLDNLILGNLRATAALYMNGHLRKFFYYPQRLTNAELTAFSK